MAGASGRRHGSEKEPLVQILPRLWQTAARMPGVELSTSACAFTMLRDYARNTNQHLTDIARNFVTGGSAEFPRRLARGR